MNQTPNPVTAEEIDAHYETLHQIGNLGPSPTDGFLRAGYSDEETAAIEYFKIRCEALGGATRFDALGNFIAEFPGSGTQFVEIGSHVDTVPHGGNFDGMAGVLTGYLAVQRALEANPNSTSGFRLRIWRNEESATFNSLFTGSQGAFGILPAKNLENRFGGRSLADAMKSQGVDPNVIREGRRTVTTEEVDSIDAHIELHIEQGNALEVQQLDIGVVSSIRGPWRARVELRGQFDHSGATPMGVEYRKDANLALAYIGVALDRACQQAQAAGSDVVQTLGVINSSRDFNATHPEVYQNAIPLVSGFAYFSFEVRSADDEFRKRYVDDALALITAEAARFGVTVEIVPINNSPAIPSLDSAIQGSLVRASNTLQYRSCIMPSGAGHDAGVVARQLRSDGRPIPVGMVFIPCLNGKSHCPEEWASSDAIAKGANVLALAMLDLANR